MNLWIKIKNFFKPAPTVQVQFEEAIKTDSDQITDSVTEVKVVVKKPRKKKVA
jgi:hypothetical protein